MAKRVRKAEKRYRVWSCTAAGKAGQFLSHHASITSAVIRAYKWMRRTKRVAEIWVRGRRLAKISAA